MNVLSLFDGLSGARIALERSGFNVNEYYASEVDKYAIQVSQANYPSINRLGDIKNWQSWMLPKIDLLIAGFPCQSFSIAGKQLNFEDERGKLFFEAVKILEWCKPKYFLFENVKMKKEYQDIISEYIGVKPVLIDSSLVSAQSRKRLYWANFEIPQPKNKGIVLKDIIDDGYVDRDKSYCIDAHYYKGGNPKRYFEYSGRQLVFNKCLSIGMATDIKGFQSQKRVYHTNGKCPTLTTMQGGNKQPKIAMDELTYRKLSVIKCARLQTLPDNYIRGVSNQQAYKMIGNGFTIDVIAHILKEGIK